MTMSASARTLLIAHATVLLPSGRQEPLDLLLSGGRIASIGHGFTADEVIDAAGATVLPGLVDLHTHGIGRESVASASLEEYARLEAAHGATTFYPTLFGPPEQSIRHMERHRRASDELRLLPQVGGFRLESPYLARTGAGVSRDLAPISWLTSTEPE